jgi:hypothetical protein
MKQRTKGKAKSPSIMKTKESEKCIHAKNQLKIADFIDRHYLNTQNFAYLLNKMT